MEDKVTLEKINKLADLSMLYFTKEEKENLQKEINGIVNMLDKCGDFKVNANCTINDIDYENLREDSVMDGLNIDTTMQDIKSRKDNYFVVDKVVDL